MVLTKHIQKEVITSTKALNWELVTTWNLLASPVCSVDQQGLQVSFLRIKLKLCETYKSLPSQSLPYLLQPCPVCSYRTEQTALLPAIVNTCLLWDEPTLPAPQLNHRRCLIFSAGPPSSFQFHLENFSSCFRIPPWPPECPICAVFKSLNTNSFHSPPSSEWPIDQPHDTWGIMSRPVSSATYTHKVPCQLADRGVSVNICGISARVNGDRWELHLALAY